jgi:alcohol dehydrogenase
VACGTLVAICTATNVRALHQRAPDSPALARYAHAGKLLAGDMALDDEAGLTRLVDTLNDWTRRLDLPLLSRYGMTEADIPQVVAHSRGSSMKTNPVVLTDGELAEILAARLGGPQTAV